MDGHLEAKMRDGKTTVQCDTDAPLLFVTSMIGLLGQKFRSLLENVPDRDDILFSLTVDFHRNLIGGYKELYTLKELCNDSDFWPYSERTTYGYLRNGKLQGINLKNRWIIRRSDALKFLNQ